MRRATAALLLVGLVPGLAIADALSRSRVHGRVIDSSHLPLPGVTVTLTSSAAPQAAPLITVTDLRGEYEFSVAPGRYTVTAELLGFEKGVRPDVVVGAEDVTVDLELALAGFTEETQVIAQVPRLLSASEPTAPATVDKDVIKIAPVLGLRYDSALPLVPTVVRGPDGLINLGGARSTQGVVLVDGRRENDPVTGEPAVTVPIAAIDTVQVFAPTPPVEAGPTTSGVTLINTRRGADGYGFTVNAFVPRPRFGGGDGFINGIESWQPNVGASGPIVRGVAWFTQDLEYRWEKFQNETPAGRQDTILNAFTSFTRVDVKVSDGRFLIARLAVHPEDRTRFGISAFAPAGTVPNQTSRAWSASVGTRIVSGSSAIELTAHMKRRRFVLAPSGDEAYAIGHDQLRGNYYRTVNRLAERLEGSASWSRGWTGRRGDHVLKAGVLVARSTVEGQTVARPVIYLRSDGSVSRQITFSGAGIVQTAAVEAGAFVADTWTPGARFKVDLGLRWDYAGVFSSHAAGPRAVFTYTLGERTKLSGSAGYQVAKPLLNAGIFSQRQSRQLTSYNASGQPTSVQAYRNVTGELAVPGSAVAHVQLDHTLSAQWTLRLAYQERHGRREMVIDPLPGTNGDGVLFLTPTGTSRIRMFEATVGYRSASAARQFYVSYVRGSSVGNLNDVNTITGTLATPLVLANAIGPLAADVPHRMLAWGIIALPWRLTFAPFFEVRSGFPFTPIDEDWNPVAPRNSARFPYFASLDVAIEKALKLPIGPPLRIGVKFFNLAGRNNGRDIQPDVQRSDYGRTLNPIRRQFRASLELVWNK